MKKLVLTFVGAISFVVPAHATILPKNTWPMVALFLMGLLSLPVYAADYEPDCCVRKGDLNSDGGWNVLDIVTLVNCVLANNCDHCAGDINGDGGWNVLDVVTLVNCVLANDCNALEPQPGDEARCTYIYSDHPGLEWQGCPAGKLGVVCNSGEVEERDYCEAKLYCEDLDWGGFDDWHLPTIDEWRSLIVGCETSALESNQCVASHDCIPSAAITYEGEGACDYGASCDDGTCLTGANCTNNESYPNCLPCDEVEGACYLPEDLQGPCDRPFWSLTKHWYPHYFSCDDDHPNCYEDDDPDGKIFTVFAYAIYFVRAYVIPDNIVLNHDIPMYKDYYTRCVRTP